MCVILVQISTLGVTMVREQAARYAERFVLRGKPAYVNEYSLDDNLAGFDIKRFDAYDE